jgi:hypothetical protein
MKQIPMHVKVIIFVFISLTMMACPIAVPGLGLEEVDSREVEMERFQQDLMYQWAQQAADRAATETDMVLREGQILNVRLNYGKETDGESAWYQVLLQNPSSGWYDVVRYSAEHGFGGREWDNFHDYDFHMTNFSEQLTDEKYETTSLDGEYTLTISSSHGYSMQATLLWSGSLEGSSAGWQGNNGLMAFNVP